MACQWSLAIVLLLATPRQSDASFACNPGTTLQYDLQSRLVRVGGAAAGAEALPTAQRRVGASVHVTDVAALTLENGWRRPGVDGVDDVAHYDVCVRLVNLTGALVSGGGYTPMGTPGVGYVPPVAVLQSATGCVVEAYEHVEARWGVLLRGMLAVGRAPQWQPHCQHSTCTVFVSVCDQSALWSRACGRGGCWAGVTIVKWMSMQWCRLGVHVCCWGPVCVLGSATP